MSRILSFIALAVVSLITGCASLPLLEGRTATSALPTRRKPGSAARSPRGIAAHPGKAGIHPLPNPRDAFATRVLLAAAFERSLDGQYFIWEGDQVGYLLDSADRVIALAPVTRRNPTDSCA